MNTTSGSSNSNLMQILLNLVEKTSHYDKDERYMATNDLCTHLSTDILMNDIIEKKICSAILKQLDDKSNDVQSVAVKCLSILVKKVEAAQISDICDKLCSLILDGQDALRDIYSIGLKTSINDLSDEVGKTISTRLISRLLSGINNSKSDDVKRECINILSDLLKKFGEVLKNEHESIMKSLIIQLENPKQIIRKRAALCLGNLSVSLSDNFLNQLVDTLLSKSYSRAATDTGNTRILIQTFGAISCSVGHRLGKHLNNLIPLFIQCCGDPNDENMQHETCNDLRENCLSGLESFVLRCHLEVLPFLDSILAVSKSFLNYDPNYSYEDNENIDEDVMSTDEYYDEDENDAYNCSDDDDGSWKVRKSSMKVLNAIISSKGDVVNTIYDDILMLLVNNLKDREETVRQDIINTLVVLLSAYKNRSTSSSSSSSSSSLPITITSNQSTLNNRNVIILRIPNIIAACKRHFASTTMNTKISLLTMIQTLVQSTQGGFSSDQLDYCFKLVEVCLLDADQNLKLQALRFLRDLMEVTEYYQLFVSNLNKSLDIVISTTNEDWHKIISEGLRCLSLLIVIARNNVNPNSVDLHSIAKKIYDCIFRKIEAADIDLEIKECAINAIGKLFLYMGDVLSDQLSVIWNILNKRMDNDSTRTLAIKAIGDIASSPLNLDISTLVISTSSEIAGFLRLSTRTVKVASLETLKAIIQNKSFNLIASESLVQVFKVCFVEMSRLLIDNDISLLYEVLTFISFTLSQFPMIVAPILLEDIYLHLQALIPFGSVQDKYLSLVSDILIKLAQAGQHSCTLQRLIMDFYEDMIPKIESESIGNTPLTHVNGNKANVFNIAKCIGLIASELPLVDQNDLLSRIVIDLEKKLVVNENEKTSSIDLKLLQLYLYSLAEVGHQYASSPVLSNKYQDIKKLLLASFDHSSEDIRIASAHALGRLATGAMDQFLPIVFNVFEDSNELTEKVVYLLLLSLKEIIITYQRNQQSFVDYLDIVLSGLMYLSSKYQSENICTMTAECLGLLLFLHQSQVLVFLQSLPLSSNTNTNNTTNGNTNTNTNGNGIGNGIGNTTTTTSSHQGDNLSNPMKWTVIVALKFSLSLTFNLQETYPVIPFITSLVRQDLQVDNIDLETKKASLLLIQCVIHHHALVFMNMIHELTPLLLACSQLQQVKVVDLGPFKHRIDEALPIRKASLTCIDTIIENIPQSIDVLALFPALVPLLNDKDEVKLQTYQIISKLCLTSPTLIIASIDVFYPTLEQTICKRLKEVSSTNANNSTNTNTNTMNQVVNPEADRLHEIIRHSSRLLETLSQVEGLENYKQLNELREKIFQLGIPLH